tara:strand:+ start:156 stop:488 length:333 start_codon:yes stop_codon:yes gene_type:complete
MPRDRKEYLKEYKLKNKEKIREQNKAYRLTPVGRKVYRISHWKRRGVICDDWDILYDTYLNTLECDNCGIELTTDKIRTLTTKCLDHDHSITDKPNFRNILCHWCNTKRR